eukprot:UN06122
MSYLTFQNYVMLLILKIMLYSQVMVKYYYLF